MSLFQGMSDDQIALLGCVAAFLGSAALMSLSYYLGRSRPGVSDSTAEPPSVALPRHAANKTPADDALPVRRAA